MAMWSAGIGIELVKNEGGKWRGYAVVDGGSVRREEQRRKVSEMRGVAMLQLQRVEEKS